MKMRIVAPAILGVLALSIPFSAAQASEAACQTLWTQYDAVDEHHVGYAPIDEPAKELATEGQELCEAGQTEEGAEKIREALRMWGLELKA